MTDREFHQWRPHPWHGLDIGPAPPDIVNAYIEITPFVNALQKISASISPLYPGAI